MEPLDCSGSFPLITHIVPAVVARNMTLLLLLQLVSAEVDSIGVPGRYAHCAVTFADYMVVYGGRGFEAGRNSLSTLGCAEQQQPPAAMSSTLARFFRRLLIFPAASFLASPHFCPRVFFWPSPHFDAGTLGHSATRPTRGLSSSRARARPTAPTRAQGTAAPW